MAELEMQQEPEDMMSLNDALALMRVTAAAGGSAKIGQVLLARLVEHIDSLQTDRDALQEELNEWRFTNGVDVMRRELDQLRARLAEHPKPTAHGTATPGQRAAQLEAIDEFDAAKRGG